MNHRSHLPRIWAGYLADFLVFLPGLRQEGAEILQGRKIPEMYLIQVRIFPIYMIKHFSLFKIYIDIYRNLQGVREYGLRFHAMIF